jgi:hypothetical protein
MKYNVHRCSPGGTCSVVKSVTSTIYTDSQVQGLKNYCYFVSAAAASGPDSGASNFVQVVTPSHEVLAT